MNQIKNIIQKEFRTFFNSPIGYVFLVVFLTFSGWMFFRTLFIFGQTSMRDFFALLPWTFLFLIPAFTMRSWSEEIRSGTIETLLTSGASLGKVVVAKFLSLMLFLTLTLGLTFPFAVTLSFLGNLDWGVVLISYLGAWLLGACYISLGLFISALTRNQIVAFILTLIACFFSFIIGESFITIFAPEFLGKIFHFLGLGTHFNSMIRGVVDSRDIFFYLSFILFFLTLNILTLSIRFWPKQKFWKVTTAMITLTAFIVNLGGSFVFARFDGTENKNYTLSTVSQKIIKNIEQPVSIKAFISSSIPAQMQTLSQDVKDILDEYKSRSKGQITVEILDPLKDETAKNWADNFGVMPVKVQVIEKDQQQVVKAYLGLAIAKEDTSKEGFSERFSKFETLPIISKMDDFEYQLTSSIQKVSLEKLPKVGILTDHNPKKLGNIKIPPYQDKKEIKDEIPLKDLLEKNYEVVSLSLQDENFSEQIETIKTLLIWAPSEDFTDEEAETIKTFIEKGNSVVFVADKLNIIGNTFTQKGKADFSNILSNFGIELENNLIADLNSEKVGVSTGIFQVMRPYPFWVKATDLSKDSAITKNLPNLSFPWISSLKISPKSGVTVDVLAKTSPYYVIKKGEKWEEVPVEDEKSDETTDSSKKPSEETNTANEKTEASEEEVTEKTAETMEAEETVTETEPPKTEKKLVNTSISLSPEQEFGFTRKRKTPLPLAVVAHKGKGNLLFVGNSRFITREFLQRIPTNLIFINNAVDTFTIGDDLISIRSKQIVDRPIKLISDSQKALIRWGNTLSMSFLVILYGLGRRYWRNKQKNLLQAL